MCVGRTLAVPGDQATLCAGCWDLVHTTYLCRTMYPLVPLEIAMMIKIVSDGHGLGQGGCFIDNLVHDTRLRGLVRRGPVIRAGPCPFDHPAASLDARCVLCSRIVLNMPGDHVCITGAYEALHGGHRPPHQVWLRANEKFPRCRQCSVVFKFVGRASAPTCDHIGSDRDFFVQNR
jgi:hypothetical protein